MSRDPSPSTPTPSTPVLRPIIPEVPASRSVVIAYYYDMSQPSSTSDLSDPSLTIAMDALSLEDNTQDDLQATPTPKGRKARSKSSASSTAPHDSPCDVPIVTENAAQLSVDSSEGGIFVHSHLDDDVFGIPTTPDQGVKIQSTSAAAAAKIQAKLASPVTFSQTPRLDRMNSPITPANAQGVLPPEACVFVANLSIARTDDQLEVSCHNHFDIFGDCYIKVRRDRHSHPFALVQYFNIEAADNAIRASVDAIIDDRRIRTEHAQARRSLILARVGGGYIEFDEAKQVLSRFGPLAKLHPTTRKDTRELGLPVGMWVQFAFYLDYRDAIKTFSNTTSQYVIHVPPEIEVRTSAGPDGRPVFEGFRTLRSGADQKSIFVGNLPATANEYRLRRLFAPYGDIRCVNVILRPTNGGSGHNNFGFIEFSNASEAQAAAKMEFEIDGVKIRVEPKEYSARQNTRLQRYSPNHTLYWGAPRHYDHQNITMGYDHQGMPMAYSPGFYGIHGPPHAGNVFNQAQNMAEPAQFQNQAQNMAEQAHLQPQPQPQPQNIAEQPQFAHQARNIETAQIHHQAPNIAELQYQAQNIAQQSQYHHQAQNIAELQAHAQNLAQQSQYLQQVQNMAGLTPFHYQVGYGNVFATPPLSAYAGRRNDFMYTGSPQEMALWNPYVTFGGFTGGMLQIPEEFEAQRH